MPEHRILSRRHILLGERRLCRLARATGMWVAAAYFITAILVRIIVFAIIKP